MTAHEFKPGATPHTRHLCRECGTDHSVAVVAAEARLREQGATLGTIDAYGAKVRHLCAEGIARTLRDVAGDPAYSLGDIDPKIMERIADQIERMA